MIDANLHQDAGNYRHKNTKKNIHGILVGKLGISDLGEIGESAGMLAEPVYVVIGNEQAEQQLLHRNILLCAGSLVQITGGFEYPHVEPYAESYKSENNVLSKGAIVTAFGGGLGVLLRSGIGCVFIRGLRAAVNGLIPGINIAHAKRNGSDGGVKKPGSEEVHGKSTESRANNKTDKARKVYSPYKISDKINSEVKNDHRSGKIEKFLEETGNREVAKFDKVLIGYKKNKNKDEAVCTKKQKTDKSEINEEVNKRHKGNCGGSNEQKQISALHIKNNAKENVCKQSENIQQNYAKAHPS